MYTVAWRAILMPSLSICSDKKIMSSLQAGEVYLLSQQPDSRKKPQRKVKRHIREIINIKQLLIVPNIQQTHTQSKL